jgi:hypothetical protein
MIWVAFKGNFKLIIIFTNVQKGGGEEKRREG